MFRRKRPASDYNAALLGLCHVAEGAARGGPRLLLIPLRKWSVILCSSMHSTHACWCYGRVGASCRATNYPLGQAAHSTGCQIDRHPIGCDIRTLSMNLLSSTGLITHTEEITA